jgi:hypothetical protein
MKTLREQITGRCKHWDCDMRNVHKDRNVKCSAGVSIYELIKIDELGLTGCMLRHPCSGKRQGSKERSQTVQRCDLYKAISDEEIQNRIDEIHQFEENMMKGLSNCCQAPIDESHVITKGRHKGHGPRFCSKCKRLAYMV